MKLTHPMQTKFRWFASGLALGALGFMLDALGFILGALGFILGALGFVLGAMGFAFGSQGFLDTNMLVSVTQITHVGGPPDTTRSLQ